MMTKVLMIDIYPDEDSGTSVRYLQMIRDAAASGKIVSVGEYI